MSHPWEETTVADEFEVQLGKRVDAAVARGVPRLCINNRGVRWGTVDVTEAVWELLTKADIRSLRLIAGDVLVCEGGEIGRSSVWRGEVAEAYFLNTLHRLRSKGRVHPELLAAFLERLVTTGELQALVGKSSLAHLTKENLLRVRLPLPNQDEQARIVGALRAASDSIRAIERLITKKRDIRQGLLQELLTGQTRMHGFSAAWSDTTLGDVTDVVGGGTPARSVAEFWGGNVPWATVKDISNFNPAGTQEYITAAAVQGSASRVVKAGTPILAARMLVGKAVRFDVDVAINQDLKALIVSPRLDPAYLCFWFEMNGPRLAASAGGSTVSGTSTAEIKALELALPPVDEQEVIARVLLDVTFELRALERRLESARAIKTGMMQELLTGRTRLPVEVVS